MLNAVIIDDEQGAINSLKEDLNDYCGSLVKIIGEATDFRNAELLIKEYKPNLIFLDIDLGDKSGFDLLANLKGIEGLDFNIIFTTAFNQFAIKAIKVNAFDYLLKPIDPDELVSSIKRLSLEIVEKSNNQSVLSNFKKQNFFSEPTIILNTQEKAHVCKLSDIIRCQSDRNYTTFYLQNNKSILVSKTISTFEDQLCSNNFFRSHKAHIINLAFVDSYVKFDGGYVLLKDGSQIPISKSKKAPFLHICANN